MAVYNFDEVRFLTQEEMGMNHLSFTAKQYVDRLTEVRKRIKDLELAIAEHGDESGLLRAECEGLRKALEIVTGIKQTF